MSDWPVTDKMKPRPVYARYLQRRHQMPMEPPTDAEKSDAIRILNDPIMWADEIEREAFRILCEAAENFHPPHPRGLREPFDPKIDYPERYTDGPI